MVHVVYVYEGSQGNSKARTSRNAGDLVQGVIRWQMEIREHSVNSHVLLIHVGIFCCCWQRGRERVKGTMVGGGLGEST
jgi:hypothetical protein